MLNWAELTLNRRQLLASALGCVGLLGGVGTIYHETSALTVERIMLRLKRLRPGLDGLRVAQLSDFHYDRFLDPHLIRSAVQLTNELHPDLVVLTGDFVTKGGFGAFDPESAKNAEPCAELLARLRAPMGKFAVLGNHDFHTQPDIVSAALEANGIAVLRNQSRVLERQGARLWIAGVDDVLAGADDLPRALVQVPSSEPVLLLVHEPDYADGVPAQRVDVQLSGHSHGGQIVLPVVGPPYLPPLARKYPRGLHRLGSLLLYTNRGLGTIILPARFNAPPEVSLFTLRAG